MSHDPQRPEGLRERLRDYIWSSEATIHSEFGVGQWQGHFDPAVAEMCRVVDALIAAVREEERTAALRDAKAAVMALPKGGLGLKAHALWRDAVAAIEALKEKR